MSGGAVLELDLTSGPATLVELELEGVPTIELALDPSPVLELSLGMGPAGPPGPSGASPSIDAVSASTAPAGMPLAVRRSDGLLVRADASYKPLSFVAGLAKAEASVGFVASAARGMASHDNWTPVTGTVALSPGQAYFLAAGGGLTTVPPAAPNCLVVVGVALSSTTLLVEPQSPIQL